MPVVNTHNDSVRKQWLALRKDMKRIVEAKGGELHSE